LTYLPDNIGNLSNLVELYLSSNELTYLPVSFWKLKRLNTLYLRNNPITNLIQSVNLFSTTKEHKNNELFQGRR